MIHMSYMVAGIIIKAIFKKNILLNIYLFMHVFGAHTHVPWCEYGSQRDNL